MNALPSPYTLRREVDSFRETLNARMAQNYTAGVAEGWRQARWWLAGNTGVLIAFGVCVGVTLTIFVGPMVAFILGGAP